MKKWLQIYGANVFVVSFMLYLSVASSHGWFNFIWPLNAAMYGFCLGRDYTLRQK